MKCKYCGKDSNGMPFHTCDRSMKRAKLTPPDPRRCQYHREDTRVEDEAIMSRFVRCYNKPTVIAKERKAGADGRRGSMSLCAEHLAKMIETYGRKYAVISKIK